MHVKDFINFFNNNTPLTNKHARLELSKHGFIEISESQKWNEIRILKCSFSDLRCFKAN